MKNKSKKYSLIQLLRAAIQLISFVLIPGLFISIFYALGSIYRSVLEGSFSLGDQWAEIALALAAFAITFVWGRFFCGFICSFGAMQDLLWLFGKRIPKVKKVPEKLDCVLKFLKYGVLIFVVVGVWSFAVTGELVWSPWTVFGMYASPWKGLPQQAVFVSIGGLLLLLIVLGSLFVERFFCKYFCPLGALFAIVSRFRIFKLKRNSSHCSEGCRVCTRKCSMAIPLYKHDEVKSGECIDCMKCLSCPRGNMKAETAPAVSGTLAATVLMSAGFAGTLPIFEGDGVSTFSSPVSISQSAQTGKYKDGTYTGSAEGYRGTISVTVEVSGGNISSITVDESSDDRKFLSQAEQKIIPKIISTQSTDVAAVSGATYSSRGIINAVEDALSSQLEKQEEAIQPAEREDEFEQEETDVNEVDNSFEDEDEEENSDNSDESTDNNNSDQGEFKDGVYTGSGTGFRGTTTVSVTVSGGQISDITVVSYQDDDRFFQSAASGVIDAILSQQSVDVASVSGATYSSNSIKEAVADALGLEFSNPNSSMDGGHHR